MEQYVLTEIAQASSASFDDLKTDGTYLLASLLASRLE